MESDYRRPEDFGYWDGEIFVFIPPIEVMGLDGPLKIKELDLSRALVAPGIEKDDVISAMLNPYEGPEDEELRLMTGGI